MFDIVALKYHTQSEKTRSYYMYIEANMFKKHSYIYHNHLNLKLKKMDTI